MKPFDKEVVLRLLNDDEDLNRVCEALAEHNDLNVALKLIYDKYIITSVERRAKYDESYGESWYLIPDTPLVAEIRKLIERFGWKQFVKAIANYAFKKMDQMRVMGQIDSIWAKIYKKVRSM